MAASDGKVLAGDITVNEGGKVIVIGNVTGDVLVHLREGETELLHLARVELVKAVTALFVDIMRLVCVSCSDAARIVNSPRYGEFVDIADQHVDDLRTHLTRIYASADVSVLTDASHIEKAFRWSVTRLRREPTLDRQWAAFTEILLDLAEKVDALARSTAPEYYEAGSKAAHEAFVAMALRSDLRQPDNFVRARFGTQSLLLEKLNAVGVITRTIRDDMQNVLAIPYFTIDLKLLRAVC